MEGEKVNRCPEITPGHAEYRADMAHYWARLMCKWGADHGFAQSIKIRYLPTDQLI